MIDSSWRANRSPMHLLHQAEQAAERLFTASAMGVTRPRQLAVLVAVSENESLSPTKVMEPRHLGRHHPAPGAPRSLAAPAEPGGRQGQGASHDRRGAAAAGGRCPVGEERR